MKTTIAIVLVNLTIALAGIIKSDVKITTDVFFEEFTDKNERVIGGALATDGQRPFQIILKRSGSFTCGGSLIGSRTVLTAAHCVHSYQTQPSLFTITADTLTQASGGQTIQVTRIIVHPQYTGDSANFFAWDYALLHLANEFTPGTNAQVGQIVPANNDPAANSVVVVSGFGRTSSTSNTVSTYLKLAEMNVVDRSQCSSIWGSTIPPQVICLKSPSNSTCSGDSGGPITQNGLILGVVSWSTANTCIHATQPSGIARVGLAVDFINANTNG